MNVRQVCDEGRARGLRVIPLGSAAGKQGVADSMLRAADSMLRAASGGADLVVCCAATAILFARVTLHSWTPATVVVDEAHRVRATAAWSRNTKHEAASPSETRNTPSERRSSRHPNADLPHRRNLARSKVLGDDCFAARYKDSLSVLRSSFPFATFVLMSATLPLEARSDVARRLGMSAGEFEVVHSPDARCTIAPPHAPLQRDPRGIRV